MCFNTVQEFHFFYHTTKLKTFSCECHKREKHANNGCEPIESAIYYEFYIGDGFIVNINETNVTSTCTSNMTISNSCTFSQHTQCSYIYGSVKYVTNLKLQ